MTKFICVDSKSLIIHQFELGTNFEDKFQAIANYCLSDSNNPNIYEAHYLAAYNDGVLEHIYYDDDNAKSHLTDEDISFSAIPSDPSSLTYKPILGKDTGNNSSQIKNTLVRTVDRDVVTSRVVADESWEKQCNPFIYSSKDGKRHFFMTLNNSVQLGIVKRNCYHYRMPNIVELSEEGLAWVSLVKGNETLLNSINKDTISKLFREVGLTHSQIKFDQFELSQDIYRSLGNIDGYPPITSQQLKHATPASETPYKLAISLMSIHCGLKNK